MRIRLQMAIAILVATYRLASASFLPDEADLPKTLKDIQPGTGNDVTVQHYVDKKVQHYDADVYCPGEDEKIGSLSFDASPYTGKFGQSGANDSFMGMLIRGGFTFDSGYQVCDGYTMRWLQYVNTSNETFNGVAQAARSFIDGSPLYPDFATAGVDALLWDAPGRGTGAGEWSSITWRAESALVCYDGKSSLKYIGSFFWGFDIATANGVTSVTGSYPNGWSPGLTQGFKDQFGKDYRGWTLEEGCCACVPGPLAILPFIIGTSLTALRRRRSAR